MTTSEPKVGRPRSVEADRAIHEAAVAELLDKGFEGFTVESLADRAGVGKATIYRRFASRGDLLESVIQQCVADAETDHHFADTGSLRGDLRQGVDRFIVLLTQTDIGRLWPRLTCEFSSNEDMAIIGARFKAQRRQPLIEAIERGQQRGDVRADLDADAALDLLMGPVFVRFMGRRSFPPKWRDSIVDLVARAMA